MQIGVDVGGLVVGLGHGIQFNIIINILLDHQEMLKMNVTCGTTNVMRNAVRKISAVEETRYFVSIDVIWNCRGAY